MADDRRAEFVDLARLWRPRQGGGNCVASGPLSGELQLLLPEWVRNCNSKILLMKVDNRQSDSAPEWRVTLVFDGPERPQQSGEPSRDERQTSQRPAGAPPPSRDFDEDGDDPFANE